MKKLILAAILIALSGCATYGEKVAIAFEQLVENCNSEVSLTIEVSTWSYNTRAYCDSPKLGKKEKEEKVDEIQS